MTETTKRGPEVPRPDGSDSILVDSTTVGKPINRAIQRHTSRKPDGAPLYKHARRYDARGNKRVWWETLDGEPSRGQVDSEALPLHGAHLDAKWHDDQLRVLVEGEPAAESLWQLGYCALGTVTGAPGLPCDASLELLSGRDVILWADADNAGREHMTRIYWRLWYVRSLRRVEWADAPEKADATNADPELVHRLIRDAVPIEVPPRPIEQRDVADAVPISKDGPIARFKRAVSVTDVLRAYWGIETEPGRTIRCFAHDDRSPSLSVFADDQRTLCFSPSCVLHNCGRGVDAYDLYRLGEALRHE